MYYYYYYYCYYCYYYLPWQMPLRKQLCLHSSANEGPNGSVTVPIVSIASVPSAIEVSGPSATRPLG